MEEVKRFEINCYPWDENGYRPRTYVDVTRSEGGFLFRFVTYETELTAERTVHNTDICSDNAVEAFINFSPDTDPQYINFELNSNGAMYCSKRPDRFTKTMIAENDIDSLNISVNIFGDRWESEFFVSTDFIQKFYPEYRHGGRIIGNFYKIGEQAKYPHFGCWNEINADKPDFHRPECFGTVFEGQ